MVNDILESLVNKIAETSQKDLARELRGEAPPAPKQPKVKTKRGRKRQLALKTGISLEITNFMDRNGLTYQDVADICDLSKNFVGMVVRGETRPSSASIKQLREGMVGYEAGLKKAGRFTPVVGAMPEKLQTTDSIEKMGLGTRITLILQNNAIATIGDLLKHSRISLGRLRRLGGHSVETIIAALAKNGLALKKDSSAQSTAPFVAPPPKAPAPAPKAPPPPPAPKAPPLVQRDGWIEIGPNIRVRPESPIFNKPADTAAAVPQPTTPFKEPLREPAGRCEKPHITLSVDNTASVRLNSGDNLAPHLRIDGKTMHVFTLVPGGVFLSYVEARTESP